MRLGIERTQRLLRTSPCPHCSETALTARLHCVTHDRECEIRVLCASCGAEYLVETDLSVRSAAIVCDATTHVCRATP